MTFDLAVSRTTPTDTLKGNQKEAKLFEYLHLLNRYAMHERRGESSKILLADDQYVTKQQVTMNCEALGISNKLTVFSDGKSISDFVS